MPPMHAFTAHTVSGRKRGRTLGTPTLNLDLFDVPKELEEGLYVARASLREGEWLGATLHYGKRPTFDDSLSCEVHLLDQKIIDHYPKLKIEVLELLRGIHKFDSPEALMEQQKKDKKRAQEVVTQFEQNQ